jgi:hypothetical protein
MKKAVYQLVVDGKVVGTGTSRQEMKELRNKVYKAAKSVYVERGPDNPKGPSQHSGPPEMGYNLHRAAAEKGLSLKDYLAQKAEESKKN